MGGTVVFVADSYNHRIRKIDVASDTVTSLAGPPNCKGQSYCSYSDGTGEAAKFNNPKGVATPADGSVIYVADGYNHLVRLVTNPGGVVTTLAGSYNKPGTKDGKPVGVAQFNQMNDVATPATGAFVYVADRGNDLIRVIS